MFGPAFRRNARWSVDSAVPDLGDDNGSWEDVDRFYNFWFTFKCVCRVTYCILIVLLLEVEVFLCGATEQRLGSLPLCRIHSNLLRSFHLHSHAIKLT